MRSIDLAYIDESGSVGDVAKGGSKSYTLGCVLVRSARWPDAFDGITGYRRYLRQQYGLVPRAEIKANHLLQNGGAFRELALSERARHTLQIVPSWMWTELGSSIVSDVEAATGELDCGIEVWPGGKTKEPPVGGSEGRPTPDIGPVQSSIEV